MANRIKGITIELDGNTTKLEKSLDGVNKTVRKTQSELRDVNKLLKLDPKNTELLEQKQRLLKESIDGTKDKLEQEKKALEQLKESGKTKDNQKQQDALQREIVETTNKLKGLEEEQRKLQNMKLEQLGEQFQKLGGKISKVGDNMTKFITLPIAAMGAASIAAFNDVDSGMDILVKKTGATGAELKAMEDIVLDLATEMPTTFEDAGAAVGEVNTRFGVTGQELDDLSAKFLKFAELNDIDVSTSIDHVQKLLDAFGLEAEDASTVLDALNAVSQQTGIDVDKLTVLLQANSAQLKAMNLDVYQGAELLGRFEKSGVNTTKAMAGMQKAMKVANAEGKDLTEVLDEFDALMKSNAKDSDKLSRAYELFGTKAGAAIYDLYKDGKLSFEGLSMSAEDNLGNVERTYENMLDPMDRAKMALNALKEVGYELGGAIGEVLLPVLKKITEKVKEFAKKFRELSPETKEMIVKVAALAAALGPVLSATGRLTSNIGGLIKNLGNLKDVFAKVGSFLMSNPWAIAVAGAALLAVTIVGLIRSTNQYTRAYAKMKQAHEEDIQNLIAESESAKVYADKLDELSQKENKSAADKQLMQTYVDQLNTSVEGLNLSYDAENDKLSMNKDAIYDKIDAMKELALAQAYQNQMNELGTEIVKNQMEMEELQNQKRDVLAQLNAARTNEEVVGYTSQLNAIEAKEKDLTKAQSQMYADMDIYAQRASGNLGTMSDDFKKLEAAAQEAGIEIPEWLRQGIDTGKYTIPKSMDELKALIATEGREMGEAMDDGVSDGIDARAWNVADRAKQMALDAFEKARRALDIRSPSRLFRREIGYNIGAGVAEGIEDSENLVDDAGRALMTSTQRAMLQQSPTATVNVAGAYDIASDMAGALNTVMRANTAGGGAAPVIYLTTYLYPNGPEMGHQIVKAYDTYKRRLG